MLQYLSVARPNGKSKNGGILSTLPYGLNSIFEISTSTIPVQDKLRLLLEQAILAQTILEMSDDTNTDVLQYLRDLYRISSISIPTQINTMDSVRYARYRSILFGVLSNELYSKYNAIELLEDHQNFSNESIMLPKEFYVPYLTIASKRNTASLTEYEMPVLLIPFIQDGKTGKHIVFQQQGFTKCYLKDKITKFLPLAPMMDYILKLDWSTKSWIQFTDVIQSYGLNTYKALEAQKSVSGALASILQNKNSNCIDYKKAGRTFVEYLSYLNDRYRIGIDSFESLYFVLSGLGYKDLNFLISKEPTQRQVSGFEQYVELGFLKSHKLQIALEAAESSKTEEEEEEPDDLEDDPETNPDTPEDEEGTDLDTDISGDENPDEMDESFDDDMETTDDSMGEDSSGGAGATSTDTIEEPNDPFSVVFNITKSESLNEYFQREAICNALNSIVKNPPKEMSGETVAFLKVWLTQWVNLVSIDTTKTVLQQLSVTIDL